MKAASAVQERYFAADRPSEIVRSRTPGEDYNDLVSEDYNDLVIRAQR